ncbi:probable serine/threonine-protein kinase DDB_G0283337 [Onthophagus taurus]|uniref:probable serine/threonine-protein kinase DDB_G0283337 n=1 Tax=Onthophagus taurus TaxID=166361 RepID=UPI000C203C86|nr:uncharacterized protein LOC111418111 isoform X1 [Onthophagus taurus]
MLFRFKIVFIFSIIFTTAQGLYYPFNYPNYYHVPNYPNYQIYAPYNNYYRSYPQIAVQPRFQITHQPLSSQFKFEKLQDFTDYYKYLNKKIQNDVNHLYSYPQQGFHQINNLNENPNFVPINQYTPPSSPNINPGISTVFDINVDKDTKKVENKDSEEKVDLTDLLNIRDGINSQSVPNDTNNSTEENNGGHDENQIVINVNDYVDYKPQYENENVDLDDNDEDLATVDEDDEDYDNLDEDQTEKPTEKPRKLFSFFN